MEKYEIMFIVKATQDASEIAKTADAMKAAAGNENGAMMGFAGLNMAQGAGGAAMNAANQNAQAQAQNGMVAGAVAGAKFCPNCGTPTNGGKQSKLPSSDESN